MSGKKSSDSKWSNPNGEQTYAYAGREYALVERLFDQMNGDFGYIGNNCREFANGFKNELLRH